ncbi:MAG: transcription-repair coupling factor, partial [Chlamydiae bacterium]|nr:transcription-repair coupling factor [Chlamydiota bacterium]
MKRLLPFSKHYFEARLVLEKFSKSPFLKRFRQLIKEHSSLVLEGLWDCPKALLALVASEELDRSVLILTGGERQDKLLDDLQFLSKKECLDFPAWEMLPGEDIPPSLDILGKRFEILSRLASTSDHALVVTTLQGVLQKLTPKKTLSHLFHLWKTGTTLPFSTLPLFLEDLGYQRHSLTQDKGQFSIRGGILDIFPVSSPNPYRLEFFDDEIDRIRSFDPISQKSIEKVPSLFLAPAHELPLLKKSPSLETLLDYFEKPPLVIFDDLLALEDKYIALKSLPGIESPYFLKFSDFLTKLQEHKTLYFAKESLDSLSSIKAHGSLSQHKEQALSFEMFGASLRSYKLTHPFVKIADFFLPPSEEDDLLQGISSYQDHPLTLDFITSTEAELHTLKARLAEADIKLPSCTHFLQGYLTSGLVLLDIHYVCFPYTELSHRYKVRRKKWRNSYHTPVADFHELHLGDLVVHYHNGIGRFLGIEKQKNHLGHHDEFIILEYAGASKLYVPLSQSHLISRYIGAKEESPPLHTLGTTKWQTAKAKAEASIVGYAKDLLQLQAEREAKGGFVYPEDSEEMLL